MAAGPKVELFVQCDEIGFSEKWLLEKANAALPHCLSHPGTEEANLPGLEVVEVTLVSDEVIAGVHGEFMDDPTPTDVITFHHGEILVSVDTAREVSAEHGNTVAEETLLYVIHGFLHLNGHIDSSEPERAEMHRIQDGILESLKD